MAATAASIGPIMEQAATINMMEDEKLAFRRAMATRADKAKFEHKNSSSDQNHQNPVVRHCMAPPPSPLQQRRSASGAATPAAAAPPPWILPSRTAAAAAAAWIVGSGADDMQMRRTATVAGATATATATYHGTATSYHGSTPSSSQTTQFNHHQQQFKQFSIQDMNQAATKKRYIECMDYVGCRHFIPAADLQMPTRNIPRTTKLTKVASSSFLGHCTGTSSSYSSGPSSSSTSTMVGAATTSRPVRSFRNRASKKFIPIRDVKQIDKAVDFRSSDASQVTTAESAESGNIEEQQMVVTKLGNGYGVQHDQEQHEEEDRKVEIKQVLEDPARFAPGFGLDLLAETAMGLYRQELRDKGVKFLHGEIPLVQKKISRRARPAVKFAKLNESSATTTKNIRELRKRSECARNKPLEEIPMQKPKKKKKKAPARRKAAAATKKKVTKKVDPVPSRLMEIADFVDLMDDSSNEDDLQQVVSNKRKLTTIGNNIRKKAKNLDSVLRSSSEVVNLEDDGDDDDDDDEFHRTEEEEVTVVPKMDAVVRSRRGRCQNLPSKLQCSVIGDWRKGNRRKVGTKS